MLFASEATGSLSRGEGILDKALVVRLFHAGVSIYLERSLPRKPFCTTGLVLKLLETKLQAGG